MGAEVLSEKDREKDRGVDGNRVRQKHADSRRQGGIDRQSDRCCRTEKSRLRSRWSQRVNKVVIAI